MESSMIKLCYIYFLFQIIASAHGMKCYSCKSSEDDACKNGLTDVPSQECDEGEFCATYQYDVFHENKKIGTSTSRGCEKKRNYCETLEDLINVLVTPAVVKKKQCYICEKNLCNSSSHITLSHFVSISAFLTTFFIINELFCC